MNRNTKALEAMVNQNKIRTKANSELGITQEYNKPNRDKLWDSQNRKDAYKENIFDGKESYRDPISGNILHKTKKAAQKKYHMKNEMGDNISSKWAQHSSETDHINSLKELHSKLKHNPFMTNEDFKEIANCDENYRLLSKSQNTSKGKKSDWDIIKDKNNGLTQEARKQMQKEKINSDIALCKKSVSITAKRAGIEFADGAREMIVQSTIPLMVVGVQNLWEVAKGEKSLAYAVKDMGKSTANVAIAGGKNQLTIDIATSMLKNSKKDFWVNVTKGNGASQVVAIASIVEQSASRYVRGEIDAREFMEEIGEKGASMYVSLVGGELGREIGFVIGSIVGTGVLPGIGTAAGMVVGEVVGQVIGTIITTVACSVIASTVSTWKHFDDYKLKENHIKRIERDALMEMSKQREELRNIFEREYNYWDCEFHEGFDMILSNACEQGYCLQGITQGLDRILSVFGKSVAFKDLDEYEAQLGDTLILNFGKGV
ncbi:hypothetical protein [Lacrimispora sp.]|uniref:hypothetical protein n=1 Tax=Lacrimispora sp. TaxID=2719234 RepID=UPI00289E09D6|nr:hypothetical protein [Lacrimispora sp.]